MLTAKQMTSALSAWGMERETIGNVYYRNTGNRSQNTCMVGKNHYLKYSASLGALHRMAKLQKALKQHGLAASVIPALDGREIVTQNDVDFMLTERVDAQTPSAAELIRNPSSAECIGEGLARLHEALRTCDSTLCQEEDLPVALRCWAIPRAAEAIPLDQSSMDSFIARSDLPISAQANHPPRSES